jgi:hypothetical protein
VSRAAVPPAAFLTAVSMTERRAAQPDITDPDQLASAPGRTLHQLRHSTLTRAERRERQHRFIRDRPGAAQDRADPRDQFVEVEWTQIMHHCIIGSLRAKHHLRGI